MVLTDCHLRKIQGMGGGMGDFHSRLILAIPQKFTNKSSGFAIGERMNQAEKGV
jgi:hypothetical protein